MSSTYIAAANGNLTAGSTWAITESGSGATNLLRANITGSVANNASASTPSFTFTNAHVVDAVLLWCNQSALGSTGTMTVNLQKGGVTQASCTVNRSDLPDGNSATPAPMLFKLGSTVTGDGGTNWTIQVVNSNGTNAVTFARVSVTAGDFTRALRTTTTGVAPVAGDDLYVCGEWTAAATCTARTVTMDSTATTQYGNGSVNSASVSGGGIRIGSNGTLTYGTSASTNYYLAVKGDLEVYQLGTLTIGTTGAEIPRSSTAVLEFIMASAAGDFGLQIRNGGTFNSAGLSRTSGKNIVKAKLNADLASGNLATSPNTTSTNGTVASGILGMNTAPLAGAFTDNATASVVHSTNFTGAPSVTNVTQTVVAWLARGSGTNNRFVRLEVGNNATLASVTNGFYVDIDLQAGTLGTATAIGTGTATSASITPCGSGYVVRLVGKVASTAANPTMFLISASALGTTSYTGNTTQCFIFDHVNLVTGTVSADTTFNIDTDTGWLSGDVIAIASTTRTSNDCADFVLGANAGASSFTCPAYPFGTNVANGTFAATTYSGTAPTQAEVGLLTRNVKLRSNSSTLCGYFWVEGLGVCTMSWTECYWLGSTTSTANKRGCPEITDWTGNIGAPARSITYCSFHDFTQAYAIYIAMSHLGSINLTLSNNVFYDNTFQSTININNTGSVGDYTFDNNLIIKTAGSGIILNNAFGACTNNTVVGWGVAVGSGISISDGTAGGFKLGTFSGNTCHSGLGYGLQITTSGLLGTIANQTMWRTGHHGLIMNPGTASSDLLFTNLTMFGCGDGSTRAAINLVLQNDALNINGGVICGDTSFASFGGVVFNTQNLCQFNLNNVDFAGTTLTGGIGTTNATDLIFGVGITANPLGLLNNCAFGPVPITYNWRSGATHSCSISYQKYNQTAGDHRCEMGLGQLRTDSTFYNSASPSMRMSPYSTTYKMTSAPKGKGMVVPCANGASVNIACYVRTNLTADIASQYNSNDSTGGITLSNGNLTGTWSSGTDAIRSTTSRSTGKYYVEWTTGASYTGADTGVGAAAATSVLSSIGPASNVAFTVYGPTGNIWFNGTANITINGLITTRTLGAIGGNHTICMAIDLDNKKGWFRLDGGNWNGDASANPATGTNGVDLSAVFQFGFPALLHSCFNGNSSVTMNVGGSAFAQTAPSGFIAWDTNYPGAAPRLIQRANPAMGQNNDVVIATFGGSAGTWTQLSGTSSTATDDGCWEFVVDCDGGMGFVNVDDWSTS